jgi:hypothetical protein
MTTYQFKKLTEVYVDTGNGPFRIDVTADISFGQTFTDKTYTQKTIHEQFKLHEASNIKKANPANFKFTIPYLQQAVTQSLLDLLVDFESNTYTLNTFDLYFVVDDDTMYKIEKCVITNGTFVIEKLENLKITLSGEGTKLTKEDATNMTRSTITTRTHQLIERLEIEVDDIPLTSSVYNATVELQNEIAWVPYGTVQKALNIGNTHNVNTTMYPSKFTLNKRTLSGSISQYVTSDFNSDLLQWKKGVNILIKAGTASGSFKGFKFDLSQCTFTNRITPAEVYAQTYDWRMNDNPADLGTKITLT